MSAEAQPLVSIVTPVYNEEQHLAECIESVLAQGYQHWEYTIVDNCSKDASASIAKRYAAKDSRIKVHENTEFLAAMPNFNHALRQISPDSKYCKMVLGDDWIFPDCLERMVAVAEKNPSVGLVSAYALEGERVTLTGLPYQSTVVSGRNICRWHLLDRLYLFGTQTSVMYRSDLVRAKDPFFSQTIEHGDTEVCFELLKRSDFGFVHQVLSYTRVRPGSMYRQLVAMETSWPAFLHLLLTFGPTYLTSEELSTAVDRHLSRYYQFLGKSFMMGRDREFWDYHRAQLRGAGLGYSRPRVVAGVFSALGSAALHPGNAINTLLRRGEVAPSSETRSTLLRT